MELTTDGKMYVYGLFSADGCECESLEGLFETEAAAYVRRADIQSQAVVHTFASRSYKTGPCYGNPDFLEVRRLEVQRDGKQ